MSAIEVQPRTWLPDCADISGGEVVWPEELKFPRYPIYVPSKGRYDSYHTIKFLQLDEVPFRVVVVPEELDEYRKIVREDQILVLPRGDLKLLGTRNWIRDHAEAEGWRMHWQLDDNIRRIYRLWRDAQRIPCDSGPAFRQVEDLVDRYGNVGVAGMNYKMFGLPNLTPYFVNTHVYSCTLVNHANPYRWRLVYNDDTDFCLQTLGGGWCTILVNVFLADKLPTMTVRGGNTEELYTFEVAKGRTIMARSLEVMWPDVVTVERRFQRTQHVVDWKRFKQPLVLRDGVDLSELPETDDYGLRLIMVSDPKSDRIRRLFEEPDSFQRVRSSLSDPDLGLTDKSQDPPAWSESTVESGALADSEPVGTENPGSAVGETLLEEAHSTAQSLALVDFELFLQYCDAAGVDVELVRRTAPELIRHYKAGRTARETEELERRWYESLEAGSPDWSIYADDLYVADLWACWIVYSRRYLLALRKDSLPTGSIYDDLGDVKSIADLGCGIGHSTATLAEMWPDARVTGTNLPGLRQTTIAELMGVAYGFKVLPELQAPADLAFASEYFEHFERPVEHLADVVRVARPRALIVANTFGAESPGHFRRYLVGDQEVEGRVASRLFNEYLRAAGYEKVSTLLWNNRPAYWKSTT